jgi:branched-chain amino acid aminotransferase
MKIWLGSNRGGELRALDEALVSVTDHGLTVGDGVFETVKSEGGAVFAITRHLRRLARSADALGLPAPDLDLIRHAIAQTVAANDQHEFARVRVTYTGGVAPLGSERSGADPTLVVAVGSSPRPAAETSVITTPWTRNERSALAGLKTTSYAENVVALARAKASGATEALFANTTGRLSEGTGTNVFLVVKGEIRTPPLAAGCLAGVTRGLVLEWTNAEEADLPYQALFDADEIFLTSSMRDVQAVTRVDGRPVGNGAAGPITKDVRATFQARAAQDPDPR